MKTVRKAELMMKKASDFLILKYRRKGRINTLQDFVKKHTNNPVLSESEMNEVRNYYQNYCKVEDIFFAYYKEKTGNFDCRYLPDDIYFAYILPYFDGWDDAIYLDNKCYYDIMFDDVKHPETIAKRMNSIWIDKYNRLISKDELCRILSQQEAYFVKVATSSGGGHGVFYLEGEKDQDRFKQIINDNDCDFVIQKPIRQHPALAALNSSSVNTIRVVSLISKDGVKIYSNVVRIGSPGKKVDNLSSGGYTCGIDESGRLKKYGHNRNGDSFSKIENSGIVFEGYKIPGFLKIEPIVKKLHPKMPRFRLISWDFSVDENEDIVFIEANFRYGGIQINQLNTGPLFKEDTEIILEEVFGNK